MESDVNIMPLRGDRHLNIHVNTHLLIADLRLENSQRRNFDNCIKCKDVLYLSYFTYIWLRNAI
jgi:hypothetical protein